MIAVIYFDCNCFGCIGSINLINICVKPLLPPLPGMGPCLPLSVKGFVLEGASVYRMTLSTVHNIAL